MRSAVLSGTVVAAAFLGAWLWATPSPGGLDSQARIVQALDRLTWGIEPGDIALVERMGLKNWIDQQLHPERIVENPELEAALAPLDTLRMTPAEISEHYPDGQLIQQMALGKLPLPTDPKLRAVVEAEIEIFRQRGKGKLANAPAPAAAAPVAAAGVGRGLLASLLSPEQIRGLETGAPRQRVATLEALPASTRTQVLDDLPRKLAAPIAPWVPLGQQHEMAVHDFPQQVVPLDLLGAKVLRGVYSNRQLEDVLTDFWFNHFNIFLNKGKDRNFITAYERDAIRPYVLGNFSDLLLATAKSPAMLFYLDNWQSVAPGADARAFGARGARLGLGAQARPKIERGINENYGRELMELQTLGVDGGYTQKDVTEVARCFTGWTIRQPQREAEFFYNDRLHDKGAKEVLGVTIPAGGGMDDGLKVIAILSSSPATAHHISYELAQRFIADDPPPALVSRMAASFLRTHGDLRQVMETMIDSPEFYDPAYYRNKMKSPLELVLSAVRGIGADVSNPTRLSQIIAAMGQPLYAKEPPTGYSNVGADWVSSSGLVARLNFALQLSANQIPGVQVDVADLTPAEAPLAMAEKSVFEGLLPGPISGGEATIERLMSSSGPGSPSSDGASGPATPAEVQRLAGLVLGSPDFQKR